MGPVALSVADLDRQINFYRDVLRLAVNWQHPGAAGMGAGGKDLIRLFAEPGFRRYRGVTGLYHVAILFPDRRELARVVARLLSLRVRNYPTDHIMTKTTYLDDPEGNGIELYAESPEDGVFEISGDQFSARRADGTPTDGREPLDVDALLSHLREGDRLDAPAPHITRIGHIHLHVANVDEAVDFYHGVIGFDLMGRSRSFQAAFVSAGGYHHHVGLNSWQGEGAPPPPDDALGLRYFTVELPQEQALQDVLVRIHGAGLATKTTDAGVLIRDPSGNSLVLSTPGSARASVSS